MGNLAKNKYHNVSVNRKIIMFPSLLPNGVCGRQDPFPRPNIYFKILSFKVHYCQIMLRVAIHVAWFWRVFRLLYYHTELFNKIFWKVQVQLEFWLLRIFELTSHPKYKRSESLRRFMLKEKKNFPSPR